MDGRDDGTYLYGRRMYEVMAAWQTLRTRDQPSFMAGFANNMAARREGPRQSFSGRVRPRFLRIATKERTTISRILI